MRIELIIAGIVFIIFVLGFVLWKPARTILLESFFYPRDESHIGKKDYKVKSRKRTKP
jgi:hypothetical protein